MACADAVHAVHVAEFGPLAPNRIDTWPAARLMIAEGMKNGEILRGRPRGSALCSRSMVVNPPMPEAMNTPTRGADLRRDRQLRVVHRELRRRDRELDEDVHLLDVFLLDELQRIEVLHLAREPRRERRRVEAGDRADAARCPRRAHPSSPGADADRRHQADAGHDDSPAQSPPSGLRAGRRHFFLACDSM